VTTLTESSPLSAPQPVLGAFENAQAPTEGAPITILGVPFDNVTTSGTMALIERMVASRRPHYLVTPNVDFLVQAFHDIELRRILLEAHLVLCDGTPLLWASRWLGNPLPERVAGSDLVPLLMQLAADRGFRLFFLGGSQETAALAVQKLQRQYPNIKIAGQYSPPFRDLLEMDHDEIRRRIQEAKPDLLLVCFGCPKQEKWMAMHYRSLGVPVSMGVGGTIDFLAGRLARAPRWMQRTGTEWLFRLAQEPRRLFKRYVKDCWYFGRLLAVQWWRMRKRSRPLEEPSNPALTQAAEVQEIQLPRWVDCETARRTAPFWNNILASECHRLLDLSRVEFIDSTGLGLLVRLQRRTALQGRRMVLVAPGEAAKRALDATRLAPFFLIAQDKDEARRLLNEAHAEPAMIRSEPGSTNHRLSWQGEITAANAETVWAVTERFVTGHSATDQVQTIDLSDVRFIDSSGIGLMVRARKRALIQNGTLRFTGIPPHVRNVIRLASLEDYLLGFHLERDSVPPRASRGWRRWARLPSSKSP
jgi:N-acetylglucosaminyldiphosphoundecaprenol N-acetyl-beta-D-mannosaminyltransferase